MKVLYNRWHPYPKKKPATSYYYLIYTQRGNYEIAYYDSFNDDWRGDFGIVAWKHLPKPPCLIKN